MSVNGFDSQPQLDHFTYRVIKQGKKAVIYKQQYSPLLYCFEVRSENIDTTGIVEFCESSDATSRYQENRIQHTEMITRDYEEAYRKFLSLENIER